MVTAVIIILMRMTTMTGFVIPATFVKKTALQLPGVFYFTARLDVQYEPTKKKLPANQKGYDDS